MEHSDSDESETFAARVALAFTSPEVPHGDEVHDEHVPGAIEVCGDSIISYSLTNVGFLAMFRFRGLCRSDDGLHQDADGVERLGTTFDDVRMQ